MKTINLYTGLCICIWRNKLVKEISYYSACADISLRVLSHTLSLTHIYSLSPPLPSPSLPTLMHTYTHTRPLSHTHTYANVETHMYPHNQVLRIKETRYELSLPSESTRGRGGRVGERDINLFWVQILFQFYVSVRALHVCIHIYIDTYVHACIRILTYEY